MYLSTTEVYDAATLYLPEGAANAVRAAWRTRWGGAVIYITARRAKSSALIRWKEDTLSALNSAGCGDQEMRILLRILGGNFCRF